MSDARFDFLSATLYLPDSRDPGVDTARVEVPLDDLTPAARLIWVHESLHFWQLFSSSYLAKLVSEDWQRLVDFEESGEVDLERPLVASYRDAGKAPFSTQSLLEGLTRYWELYLGADTSAFAADAFDGPVFADAARLESWDRAMTSGADAQVYAPPYLWALRLDGVDRLLLASCFPILAHYALGSDNPVAVFCTGLQRAMESTAVARCCQQWSDQGVGNWLSLWQTVVAEAAMPAVMAAGGARFSSGLDLMERGVLRSHPIYREYAEQIAALGESLKQQTAQDQTEMALLEMACHDQWLVFALPGLDVYHRLLNAYVQPPLAVFANGYSVAAARPAALRLRESRAGVSQVAEDYRARSEDLNQRLLRFRRAEMARMMGLSSGWLTRSSTD